MCKILLLIFIYSIYNVYNITYTYAHTYFIWSPYVTQEALNSFGSSASTSQITEITRIFPLFLSHIFNILTFLFHCFIYFFAWDVHAVCAPVRSPMLGTEGNTCSIGSLLTPLCGIWGPNSGCHTLPARPPCLSLLAFLKSLFSWTSVTYVSRCVHS